MIKNSKVMKGQSSMMLLEGSNASITILNATGVSRRSGRVRMKPLEYWNHERMEVKKLDDGSVQLIHHEALPTSPQRNTKKNSVANKPVEGILKKTIQKKQQKQAKPPGEEKAQKNKQKQTSPPDEENAQKKQQKQANPPGEEKAQKKQQKQANPPDEENAPKKQQKQANPPGEEKTLIKKWIAPPPLASTPNTSKVSTKPRKLLPISVLQWLDQEEKLVETEAEKEKEEKKIEMKKEEEKKRIEAGKEKEERNKRIEAEEKKRNEKEKEKEEEKNRIEAEKVKEEWNERIEAEEKKRKEKKKEKEEKKRRKEAEKGEEQKRLEAEKEKGEEKQRREAEKEKEKKRKEKKEKEEKEKRKEKEKEEMKKRKEAEKEEEEKRIEKEKVKEEKKKRKEAEKEKETRNRNHKENEEDTSPIENGRLEQEVTDVVQEGMDEESVVDRGQMGTEEEKSEVEASRRKEGGKKSEVAKGTFMDAIELSRVDRGKEDKAPAHNNTRKEPTEAAQERVSDFKGKLKKSMKSQRLENSIASTTSLNATGANISRCSGRIRTRPLEFWNYEKLEVKTLVDGKRQVVHHKPLPENCSRLSKATTDLTDISANRTEVTIITRQDSHEGGGGVYWQEVEPQKLPVKRKPKDKATKPNGSLKRRKTKEEKEESAEGKAKETIATTSKVNNRINAKTKEIDNEARDNLQGLVEDGQNTSGEECIEGIKDVTEQNNKKQLSRKRSSSLVDETQARPRKRRGSSKEESANQGTTSKQDHTRETINQKQNVDHTSLPFSPFPTPKQPCIRLFRDLQFHPFRTPGFVGYMACSYNNKQLGIYTGFIFIESGELVWNATMNMHLKVISGNCYLKKIVKGKVSGRKVTLRKLQEATIVAGEKVIVRKDKRYKMLKLFVEIVAL